MAELKTKPTRVSVDEFLKRVDDETKRKDSKEIINMMQRITGKKPVIWGPSIIGFDTYHYKYESGREGDMPMLAFSPRKQSLTLYIFPCDGNEPLNLEGLGKYKTSKACLYIKRLSEVDTGVLKKLMEESYRRSKERY